MNKTFDELGYKAGDTVRCVGSNPYFDKYKTGDISTLELNDYGSLRAGTWDGSLGDWELVCDPSDLTWGDMTPEQQGALLLAHHQGKTIEMLLVYSRDWHTLTDKPEFRPEYAYRVKPEPVVVHHEMHSGDQDGDIYGFSWVKCSDSTYVLTYDTEDGVPVCSSVKLSKLT
jgi:hypothetical protein